MSTQNLIQSLISFCVSNQCTKREIFHILRHKYKGRFDGRQMLVTRVNIELTSSSSVMRDILTAINSNVRKGKYKGRFEGRQMLVTRVNIELTSSSSVMRDILTAINSNVRKGRYPISFGTNTRVALKEDKC